ncbi:MAG: dihydrofolate reductase family protein [Acidimicrobiia bacterium]|nr:dihydrofolate reductase family protein [Acidimicrobiia bacterium]MBV8986322.1 dihydrofolate reductase family protein [Acidimicrobiia bacterium]
MGKIVVTEFVSLDGVMDDPGGSEGTRHGGWSFKFDRGPDGDKFKLDELDDAEAQLLGRVTYEGFAAAWPSREDEAGFARRMNSMRKYVVSSTLSDADATWENSEVVRPSELAALKERVDGTLLVAGSTQLVHTLIQQGLVDVLRLMVFPIVLGEGRRVFPQLLDAARFTLTSCTTAGDGVLLLEYASSGSVVGSDLA